MARRVARRCIFVLHGSDLNLYGTLESDRLCLMLVESRGSQTVLICYAEAYLLLLGGAGGGGRERDWAGPAGIEHLLFFLSRLVWDSFGISPIFR